MVMIDGLVVMIKVVGVLLVAVTSCEFFYVYTK